MSSRFEFEFKTTGSNAIGFITATGRDGKEHSISAHEVGGRLVVEIESTGVDLDVDLNDRSLVSITGGEIEEA